MSVPHLHRHSNIELENIEWQILVSFLDSYMSHAPSSAVNDRLSEIQGYIEEQLLWTL